MNSASMAFIGLDTHKENTEVGYSTDSRDQPITHFGRIKTTKQGIKKLARQLIAVSHHLPMYAVIVARLTP
ncbi:MAG: hypothetical protein V7677_16495 [Motiliproteus sp.]